MPSANRRSRVVPVALLTFVGAVGLLVLTLAKRSDPRNPTAEAVTGQGAASATLGNSKKSIPGERAKPNTLPPRLQTQYPLPATAFNTFLRTKQDPTELFAQEKPDPAWAPRFKGMITRRFDDSVKSAGFPTMKISSVECRQSTCLVEYTFTEQDIRLAARSKLRHPEELLKLSGMYWAAAEADQELTAAARRFQRDPTVEVMPDGSYRKEKILLFGQEEMDPDSFGEVADERFKHWRELIKRTRGI